MNAIGTRDNGKWKLHRLFRVLKGTSKSAVITPDRTGGADDERSVLAKHLKPHHIYFADRGYGRYSLQALIVRAGLRRANIALFLARALVLTILTLSRRHLAISVLILNTKRKRRAEPEWCDILCSASDYAMHSASCSSATRISC